MPRTYLDRMRELVGEDFDWPALGATENDALRAIDYGFILHGARKCRDNAARYRRERDAAERLCVAVWDWAVWLNCEAGGPLPPSEVCIPPMTGTAVRAMRERLGR